jgi:hypothetical protein
MLRTWSPRAFYSRRGLGTRPQLTQKPVDIPGAVEDHHSFVAAMLGEQLLNKRASADRILPDVA